MTDTEQRVARLEQRLQALEDEAEIARLISSYGPLVDSGSADAVAALWEPDGVYDVDTGRLSGHDEIVAMVHSKAHQRLITAGCAHVIGLPHVTVQGEQAVATCHSQLIVNHENTGGFTVLRVTANHWELRRSAKGWRVTRRTNRLLDGRHDSPELLASGMRRTP